MHRLKLVNLFIKQRLTQIKQLKKQVWYVQLILHRRELLLYLRVLIIRKHKIVPARHLNVKERLLQIRILRYRKLVRKQLKNQLNNINAT